MDKRSLSIALATLLVWWAPGAGLARNASSGRATGQRVHAPRVSVTPPAPSPQPMPYPNTGRAAPSGHDMRPGGHRVGK